MSGPIRAAAIFVAALCSASAAGQDGVDGNDDGFDRTPQSCIPVSRIDRTEVIDDNTILFHMRGPNTAYANYLPRRCPNLAREDRFAYELRSRQLCDITMITVIEDPGFGPGFTCRLGDFHPVTAEEVEELRRIADQAGSGDAIDVEEVEVPADDEDEDDDAAAEDEDRDDRS
jgi:hypothetical protein